MNSEKLKESQKEFSLKHRMYKDLIIDYNGLNEEMH